ncbi:zinc finger protein 271-like isoform X2 [Wyeomyia smithii]|uniref:zinc finger protein 271-like isoform X2 n=1 Tax=Wyeomyia smithii TaxID=174621 RepID=UPI002467F5F9|nr:zinc finger protein 271-like isoform X2 [Wyeomyia smithii]
MENSYIVMPDCCRCCFVEESDMIYVFDILDEFNSKISDLIADCGGISISVSDKYSKSICGDCLNHLANAVRFRRQCQRTQKIFQDANDESKMLLDAEQKRTLDLTQEEMKDEPNGEHESVIQYIIAESPDDPELQEFDYDNLISSQNSEFEEVEINQLSYKSSTLIDFDLVSQNIELEPTLSSDALKLSYICPQCGAGFALQKNLTKHIAIHEKSICDVCLAVFESKEDLEKHKSTHQCSSQTEMRCSGELIGDHLEERCNIKNRHSCAYCQKLFASKSALAAHVRVHTQERPFPCSYCSKRFRTVGGQELHERRHSGVKPYHCDICGRGFAESSNLKVHRRTHTREKPHVCTVCNRAFARVFLLKSHQRIHTGERPFSCPECGKSFRQQGDLSTHRRIHTGDRPYRCEVCNKGFIKSSGYTQHKKRHEKQLQKFTSVAVFVGRC